MAPPDVIIDQLLPDLAGFLGISLEEAKQRCQRTYIDKLGPSPVRPMGAEEYDEWLRTTEYFLYGNTEWHTRERGAILAEARPPSPSGKRACDFGGGIGTRALLLVWHGWDTTLVEINEPNREFARYRSRKLGLPLEVISSLEETSDEFDLIYLIDVIGHLTDPNGVIQEIVRKLKPDGLLRVTFDNFLPTDLGSIHRNAEVDFRRLLAKTGLEQKPDGLWAYHEHPDLVS